MSRNKLFVSLTSTKTALRTTSVATMVLSWRFVHESTIVATDVVRSAVFVEVKLTNNLFLDIRVASHHICRYYGAFMDKSTGTISIAMEFCEGGSLDSVVMIYDGMLASITERRYAKID
jgi:serine/threonine protein kinase